MYRNCIFCSADLGRNDSIEEFPVGSRLAFDGARGRLWAVCGSCTRWNLAPIEERWEAIESAEKQFRDSRLRVHSENIGLARLPDGTRLIRIGEAVPRELAAWRYGDQLVRRRRQALLWGGVGATAAGVVALGGIALAAAPVVPLLVNSGSIVNAIWTFRHHQRVLHQLTSSEGAGEKIRVVHMQQAQLVPAEGPDGVALRIPSFGPQVREEDGRVVRWRPADPWIVRGEEAERLLAKTMVRANARGARRRQLDGALDRLVATESRAAFLRRLSEGEAGIFPASIFNPAGNQHQPLRMPDFKGGWQRFAGTFRGERIPGTVTTPVRRRLDAVDALALEMALHEESERRAMQGELKLLESAWREAEEIAAIADVLPDDPLEKIER